MKQCLGEWHLKPEIGEARRVREALSEALQASGAPHADAFQLACAELIVNLSRYPDPKPTEVVLSFSRDDYYWWLELKDNGPSFNNFSQLINDADSVEAAESGMGLKLLAQMFQDMRYIPACYREDACNLMVLRQPASSEPEKTTLLLVDDDTTYRTVLKAYLDKDYAVIEAESVKQAFTQVLNYKPDLVICDIHMPEQDGSALFDQISHIPDVADTAFIYLSGCQEEEIISQALSRPIDDFIAKPVTREEIISAIERVVQRRRHLNHHIRHELEQKVSLGLTPRLPERIPGFAIQLRSLNPEPGGGDLVQLQQHGQQSLILMADLMGHGLSAKGFSYALAGYLRGLTSAANHQHINLRELFALLSQSFEDDIVLRETLATLIAVSLDESGTMSWANAGQPFPLMISQKGIETLNVEGALPGMGVNDYKTLSCQLQPGERVLCYSDGFNDAGADVPDDLLTAIKASYAMPLSAAADFLLTARLKQGRADDDITLMLIEKM